MKLVLYIPINSGLDPMIRKACKLAGFGSNYEERIVAFDFNGVIVSVKWDSDPELIRRDFLRATSGYIDSVVGPYPRPILTDEEKESDARIEADNQRRYQLHLTELQSALEAHRAQVEARLSSAPEMLFSDRDTWDRESEELARSIYGTSIAEFTSRWARLMQLEMSEGKTLDEIWAETRDQADTDGESGNTVAIATDLLARTWVHGPALRRLHNARWAVHSDEGTFNPAVLAFEVS